MGQGLHVLGNVMLETQDRTDTVAGVVDPVLHGHGPFQDRPQALNPAAGSAGLDEEVQSVSIGVSSGRSGADEGSQEGMVVGTCFTGIGNQRRGGAWLGG